MTNLDSFKDEIREYLDSRKLLGDSDFIYHYTSAASLKSIIESQSLWLTERNFLNDILDYQHVKSLVEEVLVTDVADFKGSLLEREFLSETPQYIFSTSVEFDKIHHWSYYSNCDGYCIEFRRKELQQFIEKCERPDEMSLIGQVIYQEEVARYVLKKVVETRKDEILTALSKPHEADGKALRFLNTLFHFLTALIKQEAHSCESEYRILLRTNREPEFRVQRGMLTPYLVLAPEDGSKLPISRIIVGPGNHDYISRKGLRLFLDIKGYQSVEVVDSKLRVR